VNGLRLLIPSKYLKVDTLSSLICLPSKTAVKGSSNTVYAKQFPVVLGK